jgi:hypothetical protein
MSSLIDTLMQVIADAETSAQNDKANKMLDSESDDPQKLESEVVYRQLNAVRDWINLNLVDFECYLEDVWNEHHSGETWFEYIVRSLHTFNDMPTLGYDIYDNHKDAKGVWHLRDYRRSMWLKSPQETFKDLQSFVNANLPSGVDVISLN